MRSFNYRNLISSMGGPWTVVDDDNNNDGFTFTSDTTVSEISCGLDLIDDLTFALVDSNISRLSKGG